jgi:hypothetical protein
VPLIEILLCGNAVAEDFGLQKAARPERGNDGSSECRDDAEWPTSAIVFFGI